MTICDLRAFSDLVCCHLSEMMIPEATEIVLSLSKSSSLRQGATLLFSRLSTVQDLSHLFLLDHVQGVYISWSQVAIIIFCLSSIVSNNNPHSSSTIFARIRGPILCHGNIHVYVYVYVCHDSGSVVWSTLIQALRL